MPLNCAIFQFHKELNDFLPSSRREKYFKYFFSGKPSVKDAIEAIGIPHTEIDMIVINGESVDFEKHIYNGDSVDVYPVYQNLNISPVIKLNNFSQNTKTFILDVHLGKLTRVLRMFGFDCLYENDFSDLKIIDLALEQKRIILTRDIGLLKNKIVSCGYWVRSTLWTEQIKQVFNRFELYSQTAPFTRCIVCNGIIKSVEKKNILDKLPPNTAMFYNEYSQCQKCYKIYWKGSHYQKILKIIEKFS